MMIQWDLHHSELTTPQLYALLKLRSEVFVVEQQCVYQDVDDDDLVGENRHLLGRRDGGLPAYTRIPKNKETYDPAVASRVIADPVACGEKLGHQLMTQALASCQRHRPQRTIHLEAQAHLQTSYAHFGFTSVTEAYNEDDTLHIGMARESHAG